MIKARKIVLAAFGVLILAAGCSQQAETRTAESEFVIADTITYRVDILCDDPYEASLVERLDRQKLLDGIFQSIYNHKVKVTDFTDGHVMSLDEIKTREIEDDRYSRDKISVIQFTEEWKYDIRHTSFLKKIIKIHLAYEVRDAEGEKIGDRAGIVIEMN